MSASYRFAAIFDYYSRDSWDPDGTYSALRKRKRNSECLMIFWRYGEAKALSSIAREARLNACIKTVDARKNPSEPVDGIWKVIKILSESIADAGVVYLIGVGSETEKALKDEFKKKGKNYETEKASDIEDLCQRIEKRKKEEKQKEAESLGAQVDDMSSARSSGRHDGKMAKPQNDKTEKINNQTKKPDGTSKKKADALHRAEKSREKQKSAAPLPKTSHFDPDVQKEREAAVFIGRQNDSLDDFEFPMDPMEIAKENVATLTFQKTMEFLVSAGFANLLISPQFEDLAKKDKDSFRGKCNILFSIIIMSPDPTQCHDQWNIAEPNFCPGTLPPGEKMQRLEASYSELQKHVNYYLEVCNTLYMDDPQG